MTTRYEVAIDEAVRHVYFVTAKDEDEAMRRAVKRYEMGDDGDMPELASDVTSTTVTPAEEEE